MKLSSIGIQLLVLLISINLVKLSMLDWWKDLHSIEISKYLDLVHNMNTIWKGKYILMDFYGKHCYYCIQVKDDFNRLIDELS